MKKKKFFTVSPSTDREKKNLLFLNLITKHKSISRTDLSKLTGINIVTVSNYVNGYLKKDLVLERGYDISSGGRRPELIELNKKWGYIIGIDIGEDCIRGILADFSMEILADESVHDYEEKKLKSTIDNIIKKLLNVSKTEKGQVKKISISVSTKSDGIMKETIKARDIIEEEIKISVLIGDSALCAAFGEKVSNSDAKVASSILYIYKDLGQGVFIKGDEFYDASNEKSKCAYLRPWGKKLGIVDEAKRIVARGVGTKIVEAAQGNIENITMKTVIKTAKEQDEIALDLVRMAGLSLGIRIAYLINLFESETVIIGGGIEEAGNLFLEPLKLSIKRFILQRIIDKVKLVLAMSGKDACVKGGISLGIREVFLEA